MVTKLESTSLSVQAYILTRLDKTSPGVHIIPSFKIFIQIEQEKNCRAYHNRVGGNPLLLLDYCDAAQLVIGSLAVLGRLMSADASIAATDGFIAQKAGNSFNYSPLFAK